jgi:hypothetical protein
MEFVLVRFKLLMGLSATAVMGLSSQPYMPPLQYNTPSTVAIPFDQLVIVMAYLCLR